MADTAEREDWEYHNSYAPGPLPVLFNFLEYTYRRLAEEEKFVMTPQGDALVYNTGLVTPYQEPIFAYFELNQNPDQQQWYHNNWLKKSDWLLGKFPQLPDMASYIDDPKKLVLDLNKELQVNVEHIVADNKERFPEPYRSMNDFQLVQVVKGALDTAKERVRRNYKTAVPQYYRGRIQLLLPLCLSDPSKADLAITIEQGEYAYRAATCLTLDMAYNNARQLARPDRDWLQP